MSADASERENETWWIWPVFLEKWLRHASGRSALFAGITFALACIDRSAVMRERSHTRVNAISTSATGRRNHVLIVGFG